MKTFFVIFLASGFLISGILNVLKQIRITKAIDEIIRFIGLAKIELHYRNAEYDYIVSKGKEQNYKYLSFSGDEIFVGASIGEKLKEDFNCFVKKIGTTDEDGQINLCEEYQRRFEDVLNNRKLKEKEKLQVNTALSVFGALTVLIFFL